jgi:hypothetical protein
MGNAMKLSGTKHLFLTGGLLMLAFAAEPTIASAQEVTYYNFDVPQSTPSQTSYQCPSSSVSTNVLFCFDNLYSTTASPTYLSDTYPANVNPGGTNPNYAVQLTPPTGYQGSSMWFSVPQQVSSGFSAYFAFKLTPSAASFATADGFAFVIQNSSGGGAITTSVGNVNCYATGAGANIVGAAGGCMGYGGIDNSLAIEFDMYLNPWDPTDIPGSPNDNHVAIQNCGPGAVNSPDHTGTCLATLAAPPAGTPLTASIIDPAGITMADGNVHEVVVSYSGPNEQVPNLLQVYIDPVFNAGTHTPVAGSTPVISGIYNIAGNVYLATGTSAYVGFTSGTGAAFEQHELLAWTYTPHTSVTQQQPLNPPGTPTTFPFGSHTYAVTYPTSGPPTSGINMVVTANTISPSLFQSLVAGGPYQGAQCQVYDDTGGNCVVDSVSCNQGGEPIACPAIAANDNNPGDLINVLMAFNNSTPLVTPGLLQGDPLYTLLTSISGDGKTATVTCQGECSVTVGQTVKVEGSSVGGFDGTVTVASAPEPNVFTYASTTSASSATGGYITSTNVQNIFSSYTDAIIDSGVTGKTKQFSDFVVTAVTPPPTGISLSSSSLNFGTLYLGGIAVQSVTLTNTGSTSISINQPFLSDVGNGDSKEFVALSLCPKSLAAGKSCKIYITFLAGPSYNTQTAILKITDSAPNSPQSVNLTANVINPQVKFAPAAVNFGNNKVGTSVQTSVQLSNSGATLLTISSIGLKGSNAGDYSETNNCLASLAPGANCSVSITFTPTKTGSRTATVYVNDNEQNGSSTLGLSGTGK